MREISLALLLTTFGVAPEVAVALGLLLSLRALLEGAMGALVEAKAAVRPRRPDPAGPVATSGSSPCASA